MRKRIYSSTLHIVSIYLVVGILWIFLSDSLLFELAQSAEVYSRLQTAKGWIFVLITALILFSLIRRELARRDEVQRRLEEMIEDREQLMRELNHRVRNSLQVALSIFNMQIFELEDSEAALGVLTKTRNRLQTITTCLDTLYNSGNLSVIELSTYLERIAQNSITSLRGASDDVRLTSRLTQVEASLETAVPVGLVVNEIVENSMLHAFERDGEGDAEERHIELRLEWIEDELRITLSDNGCGISGEEDVTGGIGFSLIDSLLKQIGGRYEMEPARGGGGTTVRLLLGRELFDFAKTSH
jgi:two-component sensor histidine kinase